MRSLEFATIEELGLELSKLLNEGLIGRNPIFYTNRKVESSILGGRIHLSIISRNGGISHRNFVQIDHNNRTYSIRTLIPGTVEYDISTFMQKIGYSKK